MHVYNGTLPISFRTTLKQTWGRPSAFMWCTCSNTALSGKIVHPMQTRGPPRDFTICNPRSHLQASMIYTMLAHVTLKWCLLSSLLLLFFVSLTRSQWNSPVSQPGNWCLRPLVLFTVPQLGIRKVGSDKKQHFRVICKSLWSHLDVTFLSDPTFRIPLWRRWDLRTSA